MWPPPNDISALRERLRNGLPVIPGVKLEVGDRKLFRLLYVDGASRDDLEEKTGARGSETAPGGWVFSSQCTVTPLVLSAGM